MASKESETGIMKTLITSLFILSSFLSPVAMARTKEAPIGLQLNQILHQRLGIFVDLLNDAVTMESSTKAHEKYFSHHKGLEKENMIKVLKALKENKVKFRSSKMGILAITPKEKISIEIVDYISAKFRINGHPYRYDREAGFGANVTAISELLVPKKTTYLDYFVNDAHAVVPLVIVGWALIAGGSAAYVSDGIYSPSMNDIANSRDPEVREKIKELQEKFTKRADHCENDLAMSYGMGKSQVEGLSSVKVVGSLIEELNAELYNEWFNGKEQINYEDYSCEAYDNVDGIRNRKAIGIASFGPGRVLKDLCFHQERLNKCFAEIEEVMRKNNVQVNDVSGPDHLGPYHDLVKDYKVLDEASSR